MCGGRAVQMLVFSFGMNRSMLVWKDLVPSWLLPRAAADAVDNDEESRS